MFKNRSKKLERIDTGDYTSEEYERFLREIGFINRNLGDNRTLKKTLLREISQNNPQDFSVLDVGAGSGELLRTIVKYARRTNRKAQLFGLELNERSAKSIMEKSINFSEIRSVRADVLNLPFADKSFDYTICSLFTHHFLDENVIKILKEINRVSRRNIFVMDLHRHPLAYFFYRIFCKVFRISQLVRHDGSLSILRSFKPNELRDLAQKAGIENISVERYFPFRIVLRSD
ncbi:hypothetical protein BH10ACI1_BH10ACI1_12920 [soil metagenome]